MKLLKCVLIFYNIIFDIMFYIILNVNGLYNYVYIMSLFTSFYAALNIINQLTFYNNFFQ